MLIWSMDDANYFPNRETKQCKSTQPADYLICLFFSPTTVL